MEKIAVILAGGKGRRLWPLSRENYPKQFVEFKDNLSLFQLTLKRLLLSFSSRNIYIISQENYKFTIHNQIALLPGLGARVKNTIKKNLIFEPIAKSTLPAILLAIKYIETVRKPAPDNLIHIFPSDHIIEPISKFRNSLGMAAEVAKKDKIAVFGVTLSLPQEGYGYVMAGEPFYAGFLVKKFIEKPTLKEAGKLLKKGALCNAGIFCFSQKTFLGELRRLKPEIFKHYSLNFKDFLKKFKNCPEISMDYGIMQKTKKAALVKFEAQWTDLGSWDSFLKFYLRKGENFKIGRAEFLGSRNCFAYSKNKLTCFIGLKDVLAIDSPDALLLVKKGSSAKVKELVSLLDRKGYPQVKDSSTVYRPWGYYTVLDEKEGYKVKEIGIYPAKSISLQKHRYRSEHWNVVRGEAVVLIKGKQKKVRKNESIFVPQDTKHKVHNPTDKITKIIEIQIGNYLGEDDICRFSDYR